MNRDDPEGRKRREHIQRLIEDSRNADEVQKKVTDLFFSARDLLKPVGERTWIDEYGDVFKRRESAKKRQEKHGEEGSEAEAKIAQLPDVDIQQLRTTRDRYREQEKDAQDKEIRLRLQLENKKKSEGVEEA